MSGVRRTAYSVATASIIAVLGLASEARADGLELRFVTYNAWDMPAGLSKANAPRIERIGPALAALAPDIVCFQELWIDEDAARVAKDLAAVGLVHARRFPSGLVGSGLHVFSRLPILDAAFLRYSVGGQPWKLWHCDYYGGKGIARVRVATPLGPLDVADTHMHAVYSDEAEYLATRTAEALEAAEFLSEKDGVPLVLGADLNAWKGSLPFELLAHGAAFASLPDEQQIDWIIARPGASLSARVVSYGHALAGPTDLGGGVRMPLSDHEARLAVVALERRERGPTMRAVAGYPRAQEARAVLERELSFSRLRSAIELLPGLALVGGAGALIRRKKPARLVLRLPLVLSALFAGAILIVLAMVFEPRERDGLRAAISRVEASAATK